MGIHGPELFTPWKLGKLTLCHRVVMAPMIRCRAINGIPNQAMAEYYTQRSTMGGLIIAEGTVISPTAARLQHCAGIYKQEQVKAWGKIVEAVHAKGAFIFCQLIHVGRASHNAYQPGGVAPISSTNKPISRKKKIILPDGSEAKYSEPQSLTSSQVNEVVNQFRQAAFNAIQAGFDGVEIHAGHGYLIDQFLKDSINDRTDGYGGSFTNRCKFLIEVVTSVAHAIGASKVAIRVSPVIDHLDAFDSNPLGLALAVVHHLNMAQLELNSKFSYLHLTHPRFTARDASGFKSKYVGNVKDPYEEMIRMIRNAYEGSFMCSGGFTRESGIESVAKGEADLIAYGRLFISNPDLVNRFISNAPLNEYVGATFYTFDPIVGYTNYPFLCVDKESKNPYARL